MKNVITIILLKSKIKKSFSTQFNMIQQFRSPNNTNFINQIMTMVN